MVISTDSLLVVSRVLSIFYHVILRVKKMNEEIDNDPDFEQNSIDPFDSDESEIDDSDHENDPPVERIVAHLSY